MNKTQFDYKNAIKDLLKKKIEKSTEPSIQKIIYDSFNEIKEKVLSISEIYEWPEIDELTFKEFFESVKNEVLANSVTEIKDANILKKPGPDWIKDKDIAWNYTERYLKHLERIDRSQKTINEIETSSYNILSMLGNPKSSQPFYKRGLVSGDVQSGKTGNFNAVINRAIDSGYRLIIVLSGIMDDLRVQTQKRIESDVIGSRNGVAEVANFGYDTDLKIEQASTITSIEKDFNDDLRGADFSLKHINVMICKKNISILENITSWLHSKTVTEKKEKLNIPLLIIDDEADNASLNNDGHKGQEYASKVNGTIRAILSLFHKKSYLGYTATPFANVIQDRNKPPIQNWEIKQKDGSNLKLKQEGSLFPEDFIFQLNAPSNYIGAEKIFETNSSKHQKLPILKKISDYVESFPSRVMERNGEIYGIENIDDQDQWNKSIGRFGQLEGFTSFSDYKRNTRAAKSDDEYPQILPDSLKDAVYSFIISATIKDTRRDILSKLSNYQPHTTMLIHISRFTKWQNKTAILIKKLLREIKNRLRDEDSDSVQSIYKEMERVWYTNFDSMVGKLNDKERYNYRDHLLTPTSFDSIKKQLIHSANEVEVKAINSETKDKLDYENIPPSKIIAIGGNRLSRGFTLEGLSISYFVRTTNYSDSLFQMGRWFGYRPGYLDCCKIFTSDELIRKYDSTTICVEELKNEFMKMEEQGKTPNDYEIRVRKHPGALQITRPTILKNTKTIKWSFQDSLIMTTKVNINRVKVENVWNSFIENISPIFSQFKEKNSIIYNKIPSSEILKIINSENNIEDFQKNLIATYIEKCNEKGLLKDWTIAIKTTGKAKRFNGTGIINKKETNIEREIQLGIRKGPVPEDRFYNELMNEGIFRATSSSANIMTSPSDMKVAISEHVSELAEEEYRQQKSLYLVEKGTHSDIASAKEEIKGKTIPERVYREKISKTEGVLIVYLFDPNYIFEGNEDRKIDHPIVTFALGFPQIPTLEDPAGNYTVGDYHFEESTSELEEDSTIIKSYLPEDSEAI